MACCVFPSRLLLAITAAVVSAAATTPGCSSTRQLQMQMASSGTIEGLFNETLPPGCQQILYVSGSACGPSSFLTMELWDLERSSDGVGAAMSDDMQAQPFLVVARGGAPQGIFNATSTSWRFVPSSSLSDVAGQSLLRPYLQVQAPFGATADVQASSFDANCTADNPCWYATVLNSQALMVHELQFQFRATCSASPQCPAPDWMGSSSATEYCAGNGRCQVAVVPPQNQVSCDCDPGWGDVGCSKPLTQLLEAQTVGNAALPAASWAYYAVTLPMDASTLIVEMSRTRGDPILFLKGLNEGFELGALPSTLDHSRFADRNSWRERADRAQLVRTGASPGIYYVGVFNNNDDIQEPANFTLTATWSSGRTAICPWDCNGNGRCTLAGVCTCNSNFGGEYCDGTLAPIQFAKGVSGSLQPGVWSYYSLDLTSTDSRQQALSIEFSNNAGQGIILASFGIYPTLLNANFTFRAGQMVGPLSQLVQPANLVAGVLYFGIYNMDYYVHSPFAYTLQVSQARGSRANYTPWISIGVALGVCGTLGFLIYQCHRAWLRRRAGAQGWAIWSWRPMPRLTPAVRRRRVERRRGLDPALFQNFPTYTHDASKLARGESQTPKTPIPSEDEKLCSVCLCDYDDGDLIRQLLPCRHDFHCKCIDQWLMKNSTCPMCRVSLIPEGYVPAIERQSVGGGISVQPGEERPAAIPSSGPASDIQLAQMERGEEPITDPEGATVPIDRAGEDSEAVPQEPALEAVPDASSRSEAPCEGTLASSSRSEVGVPTERISNDLDAESAGGARTAVVRPVLDEESHSKGLKSLKRWLPTRRREPH